MVKKIVKKAPAKKVPAKKVMKLAGKKIVVAKKTLPAVKKSKVPMVKKVIKPVAKKVGAKVPALAEGYDMETYLAYFGLKKAAWYKRADDKKFAWSWWAFVFPVFYLLVRKSYIMAILWFLMFSFLSYMPINVLLMFVVFGTISAMTLPYIVLARFKRVRAKIEAKTSNNTERLLMLACKGGRTFIITAIILLLQLGFMGYMYYKVDEVCKFLQANPAEVQKLIDANPDSKDFVNSVCNITIEQ